uniref:Uncharacterized protein n=2 Tax=Cyprinus carpio TaxID=7962 RepID=A0A8C1PLE7_CYPCA
MGCKLQKPRGSDEAPGKIFSTLRRAQVETHSGVAYTYHFLDFLLGKEVSSLLCLSSVRELPLQVCELYQKGFVLAAVHPFVHSCGPLLNFSVTLNVIPPLKMAPKAHLLQTLSIVVLQYGCKTENLTGCSIDTDSPHSISRHPLAFSVIAFIWT